jgi:hypothetical protein
MKPTTPSFVALLAVVANLSAQTGDAIVPSTPDDYRNKVYIACSVVFLLIIAFLVMTHRRNARVADDVAQLERRLGELQGKRA